MQVDGIPYRTIWLSGDGRTVDIIDQTLLPHDFGIVRLETLEDAARAIETMQVRGAPLIGVTAAYGVCLALREDASDAAIERGLRHLAGHAADRGQPALGARRTCGEVLTDLPPRAAAGRGLSRGRPSSPTRTSPPAAPIGDHGLPLIREPSAARSTGAAGQRADPLQRRLAGDRRLGHGLAPIYKAHDGRHPRARVGRRDAAAQPGRRPSPPGSWASTACRTR